MVLFMVRHIYWQKVDRDKFALYKISRDLEVQRVQVRTQCFTCSHQLKKWTDGGDARAKLGNFAKAAVVEMLISCNLPW